MMKIVFPASAFIFACCVTASSYAQDTLPSASLFFTPQEAHEAEVLAQKLTPAGQGDIHLGAVMYYGPKDWTLWIQGEKWTPETSRDDLHVLAVTANEVHLSWRGEDGVTREIALAPNESYQISTGKIISAP
jgi:hypothetical protein